jgi:hypothetical protein
MREYAFDFGAMPPHPALALAKPEARFIYLLKYLRG